MAQHRSLAVELLKAEDKGVVAAFSPTGLSLNEPAHRFHELLRQGHARLGDAVLSAQSAYAASGLFPELVSVYHLLGDPALTDEMVEEIKEHVRLLVEIMYEKWSQDRSQSKGQG